MSKSNESEAHKNLASKGENKCETLLGWEIEVCGATIIAINRDHPRMKARLTLDHEMLIKCGMRENESLDRMILKLKDLYESGHCTITQSNSPDSQSIWLSFIDIAGNHEYGLELEISHTWDGDVIENNKVGQRRECFMSLVPHFHLPIRPSMINECGIILKTCILLGILLAFWACQSASSKTPNIHEPCPKSMIQRMQNWEDLVQGTHTLPHQMHQRMLDLGIAIATQCDFAEFSAEHVKSAIQQANLPWITRDGIRQLFEIKMGEWKKQPQTTDEGYPLFIYLMLRFHLKNDSWDILQSQYMYLNRGDLKANATYFGV